jgi:hypothetical protein
VNIGLIGGVLVGCAMDAARALLPRTRSALLAVADGACETVLSNRELLAAHDLELPAGFELSRVGRRTADSPACAAARRMGAAA